MAALPSPINYSARPQAVVIVKDEANPFSADNGVTSVVLASNAALGAGAVLPAEGVSIGLGGDYRLQVRATSFGGGTLSLQGLDADGQTWIAFDPVAELTANGKKDVLIVDGARIRLAMTGGTGATGLYAVLGRYSS